MNNRLKEYCFKYGYQFLDVFEDYSTKEGLLILEKSDRNCHIVDNKLIHDKIKFILRS